MRPCDEPRYPAQPRSRLLPMPAHQPRRPAAPSRSRPPEWRPEAGCSSTSRAIRGDSSETGQTRPALLRLRRDDKDRRRDRWGARTLPEEVLVEPRYYLSKDDAFIAKISGKPELAYVGLVALPLVTKPGGTLSVFDTVSNLGLGTAKASHDALLPLHRHRQERERHSPAREPRGAQPGARRLGRGQRHGDASGQRCTSGPTASWSAPTTPSSSRSSTRPITASRVTSCR